MYQKILIIVITALAINSIYGQDKYAQAAESYFKNNQEKAYQFALNNGDISSAITAVNNLVQTQGGETYKDSLAILYSQAGMAIPAGRLAKELFDKDNRKTNMLEILAAAYEATGDAKNAIDSYEKLFARSNSMIDGYRLAMLQYGIKRLAEAQSTIQKTLQCQEIKDAYLPFPIDKNQNQNVPLKAAAYNLQGLISFELKDNTAAKQAFDNALAIMPEFTIATQNANAVVVQTQGENSGS